MKKFFHTLCASLLLATSAGACAQGGPPLFQIAGFRSAHFGMTQAEVRAAIERDFKPAADAVSVIENPLEKTSIVVVRLARLEPGPTPATVSYIIGATSRKLMHVNVVWSTGPAPTTPVRTAIAVAGVQLADYFRAQRWRPNATTAGARDPHRGLVLFAGIDGRNAAVEVRVAGVAMPGDAATVLDPASPAQLVVTYVADVNRPDIVTAKP